MLEDIGEISLLFDFYGELLPERQKEFLQLYYEENNSLAEIAEEFGISRQGVSEAIKKARTSLRTYEEKLGLIERFRQTNNIISEMDAALSELMNDYNSDKVLVGRLEHIKSRADGLGE